MKPINSVKSIICAFFIIGTFINIGAAYRSGTESELQPSETALQLKIEAYKKFKARYEDKDFQLGSHLVRRVEHVNGKSNAYAFNIYP